MESPTALALIVPLPRPRSGSAERLRIGRAELVLEHARGCYTLLWSDGRESRRYVLGLAEHGRLALELRAPRLPLHVVLREALTVVPGARLHGYITLPLVPTLVWRDGQGSPQTLVELHPQDLRALWQETDGHRYRCSSSWLVRFPFQTGEPQVVVPVRIQNIGNEPMSPSHLPLQITDRDLTEMRGAVVVAPRRLQWNRDGELVAADNATEVKHA